MPIDSSASTVATNALQAIPFGSVIGGPLKACIDAQAQAAQTTWDFIRQVGLTEDENGNVRAINVQFEYINGGRRMMLNIPLLTIVPIPYIAIDEIDINFKASISASSSQSSEKSKSLAVDSGVKAKASVRALFVKASAEMHCNVSSKKDSKATQESKYSVEYTMDVHVHAGQDGMPAGMAKVLEILNSSVDTVNAKGELSLSDNVLYIGSGGAQTIVASFRSADGVLDAKQIKVYLVEDGKDEKLVADASVKDNTLPIRLADSDESVVCEFNSSNVGKNYYFRAGDCKSLVSIMSKSS